MRAGSVTAILANPALPIAGYDVTRTDAASLDVLRADARSRPGAAVIEGPQFETIEVAGDASLYVFTRAAHFAHPSAIVRRIVQLDDGPAVSVIGLTAAPEAAMLAWLDECRAGDERARSPA